MEPEEYGNLTFKVDGQLLSRTDHCFIASDSKNYLTATFDFLSTDWDGMTKSAIFQFQDEAYTVALLSGSTVTVPFEVIKQDHFSVSVMGSGSYGTIITTNIVSISVVQSGYAEGSTPQEPTPDTYQQYIDAFNQKVQDVSDVMEQAKAYAVQAGHTADSILQFFDSAEIIWDFNSPQDAEQWIYQNCIDSSSTASGYVRLTAKDKTDGSYDPALRIEGLRIPADTYPKLRVRMRCNLANDAIANYPSRSRTPKVYFMTDTHPSYSESASLTGSVLTEQAIPFHEYVFDFSDHLLWRGYLTAIRFDPAECPGDFDIDYIALSKGVGSDNVMPLQSKTATPGQVTQTVTADAAYNALSSVSVMGDDHLLPENIRKDVTIFGVKGSFDERILPPNGILPGETIYCPGYTSSSQLYDPTLNQNYYISSTDMIFHLATNASPWLENPLYSTSIGHRTEDGMVVVIPSKIYVKGKIYCFDNCLSGWLLINQLVHSLYVAYGITAIDTAYGIGYSSTIIHEAHLPSTLEKISSGFFDGCSVGTIYIDKPNGTIPGSPWGAEQAKIIWEHA